MILGQHAVAVPEKANFSDPTHTKVGTGGLDTPYRGLSRAKQAPSPRTPPTNHPHQKNGGRERYMYAGRDGEPGVKAALINRTRDSTSRAYASPTR